MGPILNSSISLYKAYVPEFLYQEINGELRVSVCVCVCTGISLNPPGKNQLSAKYAQELDNLQK